MTRFIIIRAYRLILTVIGITILVFSLLYLTGDPVGVMMMTNEDLSAEQAEAMREEMGFNDPLYVQYGRWIFKAVHGDFGMSFFYDEPALGLVLPRFPVTGVVAFGSLALAILIAIPVGIYSALRPYSLSDQVITVFVLLGQSMPNFWTGIMAILLFAVYLKWLPASGWGTPQQAILPILTLGFSRIPLLLRMVRSSMLEVLAQDYIRTARAKGLSERVVLYKHALRNASIPVITIVGLQFGALIGGSVITESVYAVPGMGRLLVRAIQLLDFNVVQTTVFILTLITVFITLFVDLSYAALDPRVRYD